MIKRLGILFLLLAVLGAGTVFAGGKGETGAAKVTKMRLSTNHPDITPASKGYQFFANKVKELTGGSVTVDIFYSSVLGSEREVMEQVKAGAIDMTHISAGFLAAFVPSVDVFNVPYIFRDHDHYWKVLKGPVGKEIIADIDKSGVKFLYWVEGGSRSFYNNIKPINKPEDLQGMKIRVMGSEVMLKTMKALGATPTTTAFSEVYNALQTKVIDGAENSAISVYTMKHNEVTKFFSMNEHMKIPDLLLLANASFAKLSDKEKTAVIQAAGEAQDVTKAEWDKAETTALDIVKKTTAVNAIPDKTAWINAAAPLHQELSAKFGGLIEKIKAVK
jgi:tripartite ATP-independent transporter DctP family solute receptor